jgi:hypothetical protein
LAQPVCPSSRLTRRRQPPKRRPGARVANRSALRLLSKLLCVRLIKPQRLCGFRVRLAEHFYRGRLRRCGGACRPRSHNALSSAGSAKIGFALLRPERPQSPSCHLAGVTLFFTWLLMQQALSKPERWRPTSCSTTSCGGIRRCACRLRWRLDRIAGIVLAGF